jgi:hypothetical protein
MKRKVTLLIPYNIVSLGDKLVGADARFWYSLEKDFRRLLLLRLADSLELLGAFRDDVCILEKIVDVEAQINDLKLIKQKLLNPEPLERASIGTRRNPFRLLGLRIASLVIPGERVHKMLEEEVVDKDLRELRMARMLVEKLDVEEAKALGRTLYLKLDAYVEREKIILNDRIYNDILRMDRKFYDSMKKEVMKCLSLLRPS